MVEAKQAAEKEAVKDGAKEGGAAHVDVRESFSHEAMSTAMKAAQAAGSAIGHQSFDRAGSDIKSTAEQLPSFQLNDKDLQNQNHAKELNNMSKIDGLCMMLKDGIIKGDEVGNKISDLFGKPKDGVEKLATGDYLVREDGKQTLFTPNGDRVTVKPDGTYEVKGDVSKVSTDKDGNTTIVFGDGGKVTLDKEGIRDVDRGCEHVSFSRRDNPFIHIPKLEPYPFPEPKFPEPRYPFPHDPIILYNDKTQVPNKRVYID